MAIKCKLDVTARSFLIHSATDTVTDIECAWKLRLHPNVSGDQPFKVQAPPHFFCESLFAIIASKPTSRRQQEHPQVPAAPKSLSVQ